MYIDPKLIHIYNTEYLEIALRNPRIPRSLKLKISYELSKRRGIIASPPNPYYRAYTLGPDETLCAGVAEAYISAVEECFEY